MVALVGLEKWSFDMNTDSMNTFLETCIDHARFDAGCLVKRSRENSFISIYSKNEMLVMMELALSTRVTGEIYISDGTSADVQAKINGATHGDTVIIPEGTYNWATVVTLAKGVHLKGAGSGRVMAQSSSPVSFGTGTKVFTVTSAVAAQWLLGTPPTIANGTVLRIWWFAHNKDASYMLGTVTSLVGDQLTMDITENTGTGTQTLWLIATEPVTRVIINNVSGLGVSDRPGAIDITDHALGSPEVSGIHFSHGAGNIRMIRINYSPSGGEPALIHDCWFHQHIVGVDVFKVEELRGVVWNISGTASFVAMSNSQFFHYAAYSRPASWSTPSTMGSADTTGRSNFYVEYSDFHGWIHTLTDIDANARMVLRQCMCDHCGVGGHGYDTGPFGPRHWEFYDNVFFWEMGVLGYDSDFDGVGDSPLPPLAHVNLRGGTGVILDNYFSDLNSGPYWGSPAEIKFGVWGLKLWIHSSPTPNQYSADDGSAHEYPMPRQMFYGWVDGTGLDGQGNAFSQPDGYDPIPVGESEPGYIDGNTCPNGLAVGLTSGQDWGGMLTPDNVSDYLQAGRDWILGAKPGYAKKTDPHPLRTDLGPDVTDPELVEATIDTTGAVLTLSFSELVIGVSLADYTLSQGALSNMAGSGFTRTFTVTPPVSEPDVVTLDYDGTTTEDIAGNPLATFSNFAVENNSNVGGVGDPPIPPANMILTALGP